MTVFLKQEDGQSMIEVIVVLGVTVIVVLALVIAVLTGLKNNQFAQNQSKATKYAQEAIDKIRVIRDRDSWVYFNDTTLPDPCSISGTRSRCPFGVVWGYRLSDLMANPCANDSDTPLGCKFFVKVDVNELYLDEVQDDLGEGFSREIIIADDPDPLNSRYTQEKNVIVKVKWLDSSGEHQSNIQTQLTKY